MADSQTARLGRHSSHLGNIMLGRNAGTVTAQTFDAGLGLAGGLTEDLLSFVAFAAALTFGTSFSVDRAQTLAFHAALAFTVSLTLIKHGPPVTSVYDVDSLVQHVRTVTSET